MDLQASKIALSNLIPMTQYLVAQRALGLKSKKFDFSSSQSTQQPELPAKQLAATRPQKIRQIPRPTIFGLLKRESRMFCMTLLASDWERVAEIIQPILWVILLIIATLCEYIIPFYGVWLLGGFFAWLFLFSSLENLDNFLVNCLIIISWPAGIIICGYEKYMRWDGSFFGIRFGQGQQVSNEASDFWFLVVMAGGVGLAVLFVSALCNAIFD